MVRHRLVSAVIRSFALIALIALLLPLLLANTGPGIARAQQPVTVDRLECWQSADYFYSVQIQLWLTEAAPDSMAVTFTTDHPELLWPNTSGLHTLNVMPGQGLPVSFAAYGDDIGYPATDTTVTISASYGSDTVTCTILFPVVPPTPTPAPTMTQTPFTLTSLTCGPWDPEYDREAFFVTANLSAPVVSDYQIRLTTDRPDMVHWPESGDKWLTVSAGKSTGSLLIYGKNFSPVEDVTITITAHDQGITRSCTQVMLGNHQTETPTPSGTPPTATPTATRTPTRTPTPIVPASLRALYVQTGSRAGALSKITVCLDRRAPSGGIAVNLSSDLPTIVPVPATITVPAGRECLSRNVLVGATSQNALVTITASVGSKSLSSATLVRPARPVIYTQTVSRAGGNSKVTVCARSTGEQITLASDQPTVFAVPGTVTLPTGKTCLSLIIPVGQVGADTPVTITATFAIGSVSGTTIVRNLASQADAGLPATQAQDGAMPAIELSIAGPATAVIPVENASLTPTEVVTVSTPEPGVMSS